MRAAALMIIICFSCCPDGRVITEYEYEELERLKAKERFFSKYEKDREKFEQLVFSEILKTNAIVKELQHKQLQADRAARKQLLTPEQAFIQLRAEQIKKYDSLKTVTIRTYKEIEALKRKYKIP